MSLVTDTFDAYGWGRTTNEAREAARAMAARYISDINLWTEGDAAFRLSSVPSTVGNVYCTVTYRHDRLVESDR